MLQSISLALEKESLAAFFRLTEITGNFPMYFSHSSFSPAISSPSKMLPLSNGMVSLPISKKYFNILMFSVFPNRLGRVNRLTYAGLSRKSLISPVLST